MTSDLMNPVRREREGSGARALKPARWRTMAVRFREKYDLLQLAAHPTQATHTSNPHKQPQLQRRITDNPMAMCYSISDVTNNCY